MVWGQFCGEAGAIGVVKMGGHCAASPQQNEFCMRNNPESTQTLRKIHACKHLCLSFWLDCSFSQFTPMKRSVLVQTVVLTSTWWQPQVPASEENQPQQPGGGELSSSKIQLQPLPSEPQLPSSSWVYGEERRLKKKKKN